MNRRESIRNARYKNTDDPQKKYHGTVNTHISLEGLNWLISLRYSFLASRIRISEFLPDSRYYFLAHQVSVSAVFTHMKKFCNSTYRIPNCVKDKNKDK